MSSIKNPMRCVHNKLVDEVLEMETKGAALEEILSAVAGGKGRLGYESGETETTPIVCGQAAGLIDEIKPIARLVEDIIRDAKELQQRLSRMAV
jgi:enoyl-[acyl-carrier protein] reductase II